MNQNSPTILIVEDEQPIAKFLRASLLGAGYQTIEATGGEEALRKAASQPPDLVILDLGLPDMDGKVVLEQLREWFTGPIVVLSARDQESEKVAALDAGADDYLTKPFGTGELLARLRLAFRHQHGTVETKQVLQHGALQIDLTARIVQMENDELHLTPLEYKLLVLFMKHPGKVLTHRYLLKEVWGPGSTYENHYLRVFVANLRKKIGDESTQPNFILTEPGIGYRFAAE
jgi:two-component system, OmpR family, KDP operon response regulator KdpE